MKKLDPSPPTPRRLAPQVGPWEPDRLGLNRERACLGASGRPPAPGEGGGLSCHTGLGSNPWAQVLPPECCVTLGQGSAGS